MTDTSYQTLAQELMTDCTQMGVDKAEIMILQGKDLSVDVRNGAIENSDFSETKLIGFRVVSGKKSTIVSGSDFSAAGLREMRQRAVDSVKLLPDDPYCDIASEADLFKNYPVIQGVCDPETPELTTLKQLAYEAEAAAVNVKGITNSEGAGCSFGRYQVTLATSNGFNGTYEKTMTGLSCSVLAGEGTQMQRDYDYSTACFLSDLKDPSQLGKMAAERTVKRLNPIKMPSGKYPIIFDPRIGRSFLGYFASAISADKISRGVSFLGDQRGAEVFSTSIQIIDDPHLEGGLASVPFDSEGVYNPKLSIINQGILEALLVDGISSRKMQIATNGRAQRSTSSLPYPSATNMYIAAGQVTPEAMIGDVNYGFYVTETIGHGLNDVTGDYSIGAAGFLIEKGVLTSPVSEITIAGNLKDVFKNMTAANDLVFESRKNVPTLRVDSLTVAGASS